MPYKTIKGVEKLLGLSESALRYYEKKGIVKPTKRNEQGRKEWLYNEEAVGRLKMVKLFKHIDMTIEDIGKVINSEDSDRIDIINDQLASLEERKEHIDRQIIIAEYLRYVEEEAVGMNIEDSQIIDILEAAAERLINHKHTKKAKTE